MKTDELPVRLQRHKDVLTDAIETLKLARDYITELKERALKAETEAENLRADVARLQSANENLTELAQTACSVCEGGGSFPLSENVDNKCTWCDGTGMRSYKDLLEQEQQDHARTESALVTASALLEDAEGHVETAWFHEGADSIKKVLDRIGLFLRKTQK